MIIQNKSKFTNVYIRNLIFLKFIIVTVIGDYLKKYHYPKLNLPVENISILNTILYYFISMYTSIIYLIICFSIILNYKNVFKYPIILNILMSIALDLILIKLIINFIGFIFNNTNYFNNSNFIVVILYWKYNYRQTYNKNELIRI